MEAKEKYWRVVRTIYRDADVLEEGEVLSETELRMRLGPTFESQTTPRSTAFNDAPLVLVQSEGTKRKTSGGTDAPEAPDTKKTKRQAPRPISSATETKEV